MRRLALILLWPAAAFAQTSGPAPLKPEDLCSVEGHVSSAATGEPVGKSSVRLARASSPAAQVSDTYAATADLTGRFVLRNVEPGTYQMRVIRNGFVTAQYGARGSRTLLTLARGQRLTLDFRLTPHGVITGRVLDPDGEPVVAAWVQIHRSRYSDGKKRLTTVGSMNTNDLGEYRFYGLEPGKYYVSATGGPSAGPIAEEGYVTTYYGGAAEAARAAPLDLAAGGQARGVDLALRRARFYRVAGRVVDATATGPRASFRVYVEDLTGEGVLRQAAPIGPAGAFEFRGVPPGRYSVSAVLVGRGRNLSAAAPVEVGASDIEGIVITISPGFSFNGRLRVEGDAPLEMRKAMIRLQTGPRSPEDYSLGTSGPWNIQSAQVAEGGGFKFEEANPGRYEVTVLGLPDGYYMKAVRADGVDITTSGLNLANAAPGLLDILVSPNAGQAAGVVQDPESQQPVAGATVALVPQEKDRRALFTFYQDALTDEHGRFRFQNVVPGEYRIFAWDEVEATAWLDPDFMKPLEGKGKPITIREGGQASVQATLIRGDQQ